MVSSCVFGIARGSVDNAHTTGRQQGEGGPIWCYFRSGGSEFGALDQVVSLKTEVMTASASIAESSVYAQCAISQMAFRG